MRANTSQKTQVNAERSDVGTSLAADPEDTEMSIIIEFKQLAFVDGAHAQLTLNGGDEWRSLEEGTGQGLEGASELRLAAGKLVVESDDADILLTSTLLRLDKAGCAVDTDDQAAGNFWVEGAAVAGLLNTIDNISVFLVDINFGIAFAHRNILLIHATTSWLDGLDGLSRLITPLLIYDFRSRFRGSAPAGIGV